MEYQVVKIREHNFTGDDGQVVVGKYYYLKAESDTKRVFVPTNREKDFAYKPKEGDTVFCFFGGTSGVALVDVLKV